MPGWEERLEDRKARADERRRQRTSAAAHRMTREAFERFLLERGRSRPRIVVDPPWAIVACDCDDVNCRGWRLLEARQGSSQEEP
jgi:hypothetical protein